MTERWNYFYDLTFIIVDTTSLNFGYLVVNALRKDEFISMEISYLSFLLRDYHVVKLLKHITNNLCFDLI